MLIESKGIYFSKFYIPPFTLNKCEFVGIVIGGGAYFGVTKNYFIDLFSRKAINEKVKVYQTLTFVKPFEEPTFRRIFYPVTVREYIKKYGNPDTKITERIYDYAEIKPKTKLNTLPHRLQKILYLFATLSHTKDIVFDLVGLQHDPAREIIEIVKNNVNEGGSAILLDYFDEFENDCTQYVRAEWLGE